MAFHPSVDSFGIHRLGFKCSRWHPRQANDAVASEPNILSENYDYKRFFSCRGELVCTKFRDLDARGWENYEETHTHTGQLQ